MNKVKMTLLVQVSFLSFFVISFLTTLGKFLTVNQGNKTMQIMHIVAVLYGGIVNSDDLCLEIDPYF
jgi:hypothetical protein